MCEKVGSQPLYRKCVNVGYTQSPCFQLSHLFSTVEVGKHSCGCDLLASRAGIGFIVYHKSTGVTVEAVVNLRKEYNNNLVQASRIL